MKVELAIRPDRPTEPGEIMKLSEDIYYGHNTLTDVMRFSFCIIKNCILHSKSK